MYKMVNGKLVEMTPSEIAAAQKQQEEWRRQERSRPLSDEEILEMLILQTINVLNVNDTTALRMKAHYPEWIEDFEYTIGYRCNCDGNLYRCRQAHKSNTTRKPSLQGLESLWSRIDETHSGTEVDPIPYEGNMELESGKYYTQDGVTYRCTRSTGQTVYNPLKELVGLYVEKI